VKDDAVTLPRYEEFGDTSAHGPDTRFECKVCWYVYDPAEGDVVWQIPAGTPFAQLPPHWTCPNCSATKEQFLVLADDGEPT
jgi:rubredoxin